MSDPVGAIGKAGDKKKSGEANKSQNTDKQRKIGAIFSGASPGGGAAEVGASRKVEAAGKDSVKLSDEALGKE